MKIAFVFPGQGSQSIGMMKGYAALPSIRETFNEASEILKQDLWSLIDDGPEETLNLTINTQPVMLTADVAVYRAWKQAGGSNPEFLAGHSLGEYAALVAAHSLSFADALKLVRYRAEVMQACVPEGMGGMAAIVGLDDDTVSAVCAEVVRDTPDLLLEPTNFNAPGQAVIAGHKSAVMAGMTLAKLKGAKLTVLLPMSIPSHCSLMRPAAEKLILLLERISLQSPQIPVLHNVDIQQHTEVTVIRRVLMQQLYSPVRWTETIQEMAAQGTTHVMECGPGKVLSGLNRRINKNLNSISLNDANALKQGLEIAKQHLKKPY